MKEGTINPSFCQAVGEHISRIQPKEEPDNARRHSVSDRDQVELEARFLGITNIGRRDCVEDSAGVDTQIDWRIQSTILQEINELMWCLICTTIDLMESCLEKQH